MAWMYEADVPQIIIKGFKKFKHLLSNSKLLLSFVLCFNSHRKKTVEKEMKPRISERERESERE